MYKRSRNSRFSPRFLPLVTARALRYCRRPRRSPLYALRRGRERLQHRHRWSKRLLEQGRRLHRRSFRPHACRSRLPLCHHRPLERRQLFRETDDNVAKKTLMSLASASALVCWRTQEDATLPYQTGAHRQFSGAPRVDPGRFSVFCCIRTGLGIARAHGDPRNCRRSSSGSPRCAGEVLRRHASALRILYGGSSSLTIFRGYARRIGWRACGRSSLDPKSFARRS